FYPYFLPLYNSASPLLYKAWRYGLPFSLRPDFSQLKNCKKSDRKSAQAGVEERGFRPRETPLRGAVLPVSAVGA
ncbi:hypothetical protein B9J87_10615, partial [Vibrio sp. V19_P1S1T109]